MSTGNMQVTPTRQIVLDTETTGMNKLGVHYEGHRIIEIGAGIDARHVAIIGIGDRQARRTRRDNQK